MAPIRNNTHGADRGDKHSGVKADRKVGNYEDGLSTLSPIFLICLEADEVAPLCCAVSADEKTSGGEEKKGSHQWKFTRTQSSHGRLRRKFT